MDSHPSPQEIKPPPKQQAGRNEAEAPKMENQDHPSQLSKKSPNYIFRKRNTASSQPSKRQYSQSHLPIQPINCPHLPQQESGASNPPCPASSEERERFYLERAIAELREDIAAVQKRISLSREELRDADRQVVQDIKKYYEALDYEQQIRQSDRQDKAEALKSNAEHKIIFEEFYHESERRRDQIKQLVEPQLKAYFERWRKLTDQLDEKRKIQAQQSQKSSGNRLTKKSSKAFILPPIDMKPAFDPKNRGEALFPKPQQISGSNPSNRQFSDSYPRNQPINCPYPPQQEGSASNPSPSEDKRRKKLFRLESRTAQLREEIATIQRIVQLSREELRDADRWVVQSKKKYYEALDKDQQIRQSDRQDKAEALKSNAEKKKKVEEIYQDTKRRRDKIEQRVEPQLKIHTERYHKLTDQLDEKRKMLEKVIKEINKAPISAQPKQ